jgi:signal transduction histidine kinase
MDIDIIIRRSIIYGFITIIMACIVSGTFFTVVTYQETLGVPGQMILALALGGVVAVLFGPLRKWIELLVDKLFYKDRYDYRQTIHNLSTALNSLNDVTDISRLVVGTVVKTLNLAGSCLFMKAQSDSFETGAAQGTFTSRDTQKKLLTLISQTYPRNGLISVTESTDLDLAFLIPLIATDEEVGVLCISNKVTKQAFALDDVYLLQGVGSVAAVTLRSAMLIRDVSTRDTFVSVASHELRTPMTAIMGYVELLLRRDPPKATRKQWLGDILESGQSITNMIDDLLNVTRIQSGKIDMMLEAVDLSDVLEERTAIIREHTGKHEFIIDIEPNLPFAYVDYDRFGQVIGNLLDNAMKYSPEGGHITLSASHDIYRSRIVVRIADEGIGISPADMASLFKTFHRIKRPETQGIRGSGLGLYIVKEWVELMGGSIWLESKLNEGSTFYIAVPVYNSVSEEFNNLNLL